MTEAYLKKQELAQISTHTSLAGRDEGLGEFECTGKISTHTSLAGRDDRYIDAYTGICISTHTSLAGRDYAR